LSSQISSIGLENEIESDPVCETFIYESNIKIEVRSEGLFQEYEVALKHFDEDRLIKLFEFNKFDDAMRKLHELTVAFSDR